MDRIAYVLKGEDSIESTFKVKNKGYEVTVDNFFVELFHNKKKNEK